MTKYVRRLICEQWKIGATLRLKVVDGDSFFYSVKLADYMGTANFLLSSFPFYLQRSVRHHVYKASAPVTTRRAKWYEANGLDYYFSKITEDELEERGYLEKGIFRGERKADFFSLSYLYVEQSLNWKTRLFNIALFE